MNNTPSDDDLPTFSPRDVLRRLADIEFRMDAMETAQVDFDLWLHSDPHTDLDAPTPPPAPALDEAHYPPHGIRTEADGTDEADCPECGGAGQIERVIGHGLGEPVYAYSNCTCKAGQKATLEEYRDDLLGRGSAVDEESPWGSGYSSGYEDAVNEAILLIERFGLAAPADRAVCEVDDWLVSEAASIYLDEYLGRKNNKAGPQLTEHMRVVVEWLAAHWRGAEAGEE